MTDQRVSAARAEASRRNGTKSRGPRTEEGKARSSRNALKHGLRAAKHVLLPDEDGAEFAALEAALIEELAPVGALQTVLARRGAVAAWRLARADRIEVEVFEQRSYDAAGPGVALIRDGNGTRSFETLLRYRSAAMAEFWRALRTLKALQAEQAAATGPALAAHPQPPAARSPLPHASPNEPEHGARRRMDYIQSEPGAPGHTLHEPDAPWVPNEPIAREPDEPEVHRKPRSAEAMTVRGDRSDGSAPDRRPHACAGGLDKFEAGPRVVPRLIDRGR